MKQGRGVVNTRIVAAWARDGSVKAAANSLGIAEQTAKNELAKLRQLYQCSTNDDLVKHLLRRLINERNSLLTSKEKRKLRYDYDDDYRERVKRQARNGMRRKRELERTLIVSEYDRLLAAQGDRCAICGGVQLLLNAHGEPRRLAVDHNHETGVIRGLLCNGCNYMIGCAHDDPTILEAGAEYLRSHGHGTSHNVSGTVVEREDHAA
jgi:hypothetical protein